MSLKQTRVGITALLALSLVAALVFLIVQNANNAGSDSITQLSPEEYLDLQTELRTAIARLENFPDDGIEETYAAFERLAIRFPQERLPRRNNVIAKLLALSIEFPETDPKRDEKKYQYQLAASEASLELVDFENQSPVSLLLRAAFLLHPEGGIAASVERDNKVLSLLELAQSKDPSSAVYPHLIYQLADVAYDSDLRERVQGPAIKRAYELAPNNASIVSKQLIEQAESQDSAIQKTLRSVGDLIMSLRKQVLRESHSGADIAVSYQMAVDGVAEGDWRKVRRGVRQLESRIRPQEVVKRDLALVSPHILEFVDYQFSADIVATGDVKSELAKVNVSWLASPVELSELNSIVDVCMVDFDLDGDPELIALTTSSLSVLKRAEDSTWQSILSVKTEEGARGILVADLDADNKGAKTAKQKQDEVPTCSPQSGMQAAAGPGEDEAGKSCYVADVDIVVYGDSGVELWRNVLDDASGERSLAAVEQRDQDWSAIGKTATATLVDIDHDADLDLVMSGEGGVSIWSSQGNTSMQFYQLDEWSTLPPADVAFTSIRAVDWDRDVDVDLLFAAPDGTTKGILVNLRHARFAWTPLDESWGAMGNAAAIIPIEADGNASWDAASAGPDGVKIALTSTAVPGQNRLLRDGVVSDEPAEGILSLDYDNDGAVDLVSWTDRAVWVHRGLGDGEFSAAEALVGADMQDDAMKLAGVRQVDSGDIDGDGDLDLVVAGAEGLKLVINEGGNQNHWVAVRARGRQDNRGRANDSGVGSLIELRVGSRYQAQVVDSQVAHFGLGNAESASLARIVWTNGMPQDIINPRRDVLLCEWMVLKGSCPYLYTWNGEQFVFQTDCLWAAPIGLQVAEGVLAPSRPWEYLKIPGENLKARDGVYSIQLTEELWEIAYFDHVALIAVDHPAAVDIFSNEKVGPPEIAEYKVHTVSDRRWPVAASDQLGRDVLPTLLTADDRFVKAFDRQIYQGLTPRHYVELDLGDLPDPKRVKLFLRGWLRPTDSSLNVAFSQNPQVNGPEFPSVWVPDANGAWQQAQPFMGFPGGKTKTIVVDLSDSFLTDDYRVRIESTAEIYWDEAFFTVDEASAPYLTRELPVHTADLHYRGFSRRIKRPHYAPDNYDYSSVTTHPIWPPVQGRFTRYGDVRALLGSADDQMAVLGAGDEITVRFLAPEEPVQPGWKRDSFLHCVGFDKDADLNTVHGQSVGPLPYRAMTNYPYDATEGPQGSEYDRYLKEYQTRRQNPARFWRRLAN